MVTNERRRQRFLKVLRKLEIYHKAKTFKEFISIFDQDTEDLSLEDLDSSSPFRRMLEIMKDED